MRVLLCGGAETKGCLKVVRKKNCVVDVSSVTAVNGGEGWLGG